MAVTARVFIQILLMVLFRRIEVLKRQQLYAHYACKQEYAINPL